MSLPDSFDAILRQSFRMPRKGDRLFVPSTRRLGDALLNSNLIETGYKRAADLLVEHATVEVTDRDFLVYPVIFCYRHYVELSIKSFLQAYGRRAGKDANWKDHDLDKLWPLFKAVCVHYGISNVADEAVGDCIAEFAKIDRNSFNFRYPVDKKGTPIEVGIQRLDLIELRNVMAAIDVYFTGTYDYLHEVIQNLP